MTTQARNGGQVSRLRQATDAPLKQSAALAAADLIRAGIVDGRLPAGERLKEVQLSHDLGISRTPIREALRILQTEGLVEIEPNRGARIRTYSIEELDDMYELRALLEGYAARRAATRVTAQDIRRLQASCRRFHRLCPGHDLPALVRENIAFHTIILDVADSERLRVMVRKAIEIPLVYRSYHWYSPEQRLASDGAHARLTEALAARDPDRAELIMKEHVFAARSVLIRHLETTVLPVAAGLRPDARAM